MHIPIPDGPEKVVFQGKIIEVLHQPMKIGDKKIPFERARRSPGVRLVIPSANKQSVLITKEHRTETNGDDYRLPGGKVFDRLEEFHEALNNNVNLVEAAKTAALRELAEEVGLTTKNLTLLSVSQAGSTVEWDLYYFLVTDWEETETGQNLEAGEVIETNWVPLDEALDFCIDGFVSEERSAAVLMRWLIKEERGK